MKYLLNIYFALIFVSYAVEVTHKNVVFQSVEKNIQYFFGSNSKCILNPTYKVMFLKNVEFGPDNVFSKIPECVDRGYLIEKNDSPHIVISKLIVKKFDESANLLSDNIELDYYLSTEDTWISTESENVYLCVNYKLTLKSPIDVHINLGDFGLSNKINIHRLVKSEKAVFYITKMVDIGITSSFVTGVKKN